MQNREQGGSPVSSFTHAPSFMVYLVSTHLWQVLFCPSKCGVTTIMKIHILYSLHSTLQLPRAEMSQSVSEKLSSYFLS